MKVLNKEDLDIKEKVMNEIKSCLESYNKTTSNKRYKMFSEDTITANNDNLVRVGLLKVLDLMEIKLPSTNKERTKVYRQVRKVLKELVKDGSIAFVFNNYRIDGFLVNPLIVKPEKGNVRYVKYRWKTIKEVKHFHSSIASYYTN